MFIVGNTGEFKETAYITVVNISASLNHHFAPYSNNMAPCKIHTFWCRISDVRIAILVTWNSAQVVTKRDTLLLDKHLPVHCLQNFQFKATFSLEKAVRVMVSCTMFMMYFVSLCVCVKLIETSPLFESEELPGLFTRSRCKVMISRIM